MVAKRKQRTGVGIYETLETLWNGACGINDRAKKEKKTQGVCQNVLYISIAHIEGSQSQGEAKHEKRLYEYERHNEQPCPRQCYLGEYHKDYKQGEGKDEIDATGNDADRW